VLLVKTLTSSTFKQALIAIGTFGMVVSALFSYVYLSTSSYVRSRSDRGIMTEYSSLQGAYERSGRDGLIALIQQRTADKSFADSVYLLVDPSLAVLGGNLKAWPSTATAASGWTEFRASEPLPNATTRPLVRAMLQTFPGGDRLLVGRDIGDLDSFTDQIKTAMISVAALLFVIAGVASILVTRRTVGRIEQINATSRAIMLSGLDKRIPLRGTHDEWDSVAENLNQMLDRIETLMGEVKQVSDNVAHDLRTPLTRMRGRLEKAYHGQHIGEDDQSLIGDTIADLDAVLRIFSSITRIAHIETQARKGAFRTVNLVEVAGEVVVANEIQDGKPVISIADDGPGIPADQYEHVFKRFYRLEHSRYTPGNGLGLSLVAAVARLHGARIEMLDNAPGLKLKLWFSSPAG